MRILVISAGEYSDYHVKAIVADQQDRDIESLVRQFYDLYAAEVRGKSDEEHFAWCRNLCGQEHACIDDALQCWLVQQGCEVVEWNEVQSGEIAHRPTSSKVLEFYTSNGYGSSIPRSRELAWSNARFWLGHVHNAGYPLKIPEDAEYSAVEPDPSIKALSWGERTNIQRSKSGKPPYYRIEEYTEGNECAS